MKVVAVGILLSIVSSFAMADVLVVNIWDPLPGKGNLTFQYAQEARAIHEEMGGQVGVAADQMGRLFYTLAFSDWSAWAKFGEKQQANQAWQTFFAKINDAPSAVLGEQYMLNQVAAGEVGDVLQVFIWESQPGRTAETIEGGIGAKAIHEKAGASVSITVDQLGRMHYVMQFDSWEEWGKFQDTPNPEFSGYMAQFNQDPSATLVEVHTLSRL